MDEHEIWTASSYEEQAANYLSMAGHLVERTAVTADDEVLDVGCGTGSVAITAARRGASVTGLDIAAEMLARTRENADVAGVDVTVRQGDVTALPFDSNSFDVVLSSLGHIYGDPADEAAGELLRVARPGGHIGFTSWTPTGLYPFIGGVVTGYLPAEARPDIDEPPFMWGDSDVVRSRLAEHVESIAFETGTTRYPALSPEHFWRELATHSGLLRVLLDGVPDDDREALDREVIDTIRPYFDDRQNAVELEYLLTVATHE